MPRYYYLIAGAIAAYALYCLFTDKQEDRPPSRPPSPSRRHDDRQHRQPTVDSSRQIPPVKTYASLPTSHPQSPSLLQSSRHDDLQHRRPTADSSYQHFPHVEIYVSPASRPRPSPRLSRRHDDLQHRQPTVDSSHQIPPANTYASLPTSHPQPPSPLPSSRHDDLQHRQPTVDSSFPPVELTYASLRAKAREEHKLRVQCVQQSKEAYDRRDHVLAKTLSEQGQSHALEMENLNAQASAIIFKENNRNKPVGEVDLHGLYVKEAIAYSKNALKKARRRGDSAIRLIVGQGNHSDEGVPRLKPAIQKAMEMNGARVEIDSKNPGVLCVLI